MVVDQEQPQFMAAPPSFIQSYHYYCMYHWCYATQLYGRRSLIHIYMSARWSSNITTVSIVSNFKWSKHEKSRIVIPSLSSYFSNTLQWNDGEKKLLGGIDVFPSIYIEFQHAFSGKWSLIIQSSLNENNNGMEILIYIRNEC